MAGSIDERGNAPDAVEEQVDSTKDQRMDEDALAAIAEAENQAPDPSEFGLKVDAPLGDVAIRAENLGIRYNLNFRLDKIQQAEDRSHRAGMPDRPVTYVDIVASGTVDEFILSNLRDKRNIASIITGDELAKWI